LLNVESVLAHSATQVTHVSTTAERRNWLLGFEYSLGTITGPVDYHVTGYQASAGYKVNDNLKLITGWQWYDYKRDTGAFYNGKPGIHMNAGFLSFTYAL
jgi:hypothetical protein